jgi:outer membrane lipoprotein-sorting protein
MNRKTMSLLLGVTLVCTPAIAASDSLEDVLSSHYEAIGGVEAWTAIESCRLNGRMVMPMGMEAPFVTTFVRPMKTRLEFTIQGMTATQVFDGETAWAILPFLGSNDPQVMPDEQARLMREQADFDGPLIDWEAKGHQVELVGMEDLEGTEAYHLEVTLDSGDVRSFYLDAESYLLIRLEAKTEIQGTEMEVETIFSDYREVGDLVMAHSIESRPKGAPAGQILTMESIELNIEVDEDFFTMPESPAEAEAAE